MSGRQDGEVPGTLQHGSNFSSPASVGPTGPPEAIPSRTLGLEVLIVLGLSLGASAIYALLDLIRDLQSALPLSRQAAVLNPSVAGASLLDLVYQLAGIFLALVPVALVAHFLARSGESLPSVGFSWLPSRMELAWGVALAAVVGGVGLGLYLSAFHLGIDVRVVPTNLPAVWWRIPVLVLAAIQNGLLEEIVVCAYLLRRLDQLGWRPARAITASAVLRGTYHLYQGIGSFGANFAMGLLFGLIYRRTQKATRLVVAHSLIDAGAFVGYVLLKGKVSWIP